MSLPRPTWALCVHCLDKGLGLVPDAIWIASRVGDYLHTHISLHAHPAGVTIEDFGDDVLARCQCGYRPVPLSLRIWHNRQWNKLANHPQGDLEL